MRATRALVCVLLVVVAGCSDAGRPSGGGVQVGVARRDSTPSAATAPPAGSVHLGGYGFGPERPSTGALAPIFVRAFVISGDGGTVAFAENETQGAFADAARVEERVLDAARSLTRHEGSAVASTQLSLREPYAKPLFPLSFLGAQIARSDRSPWLDGETVGTVVSAARVGDLLFVGMPGEGYSAIQLTLESHAGAAEHVMFGLVNDQLGYLIAPEIGYAQVLAAAPGNDSAVFNVSPRIGDHVACTALAASRTVGRAVTDEPEVCAPYAAEDHTLRS